MSNARFSILQAVAVSDQRVSDAQFRTLAALGMYADKNGWCYPSLQTLGTDLGKSKQAVGRDTIALRKLGYLEVKNRYDTKTKSRHSNLYRLKYDIVDFNMDDSTPSTPEVDTPSTPEVDVNDPMNEQNNSFFTKEEQAQNETKMQAILSHERLVQERGDFEAWRGRELLPPHYIQFGDWWYSQTGMQMYGAKAKAKMDAVWLKELQKWHENDLTVFTLQNAYNHVIAWKKVVSKMSDITATAISMQAAGAKMTSSIPAVKVDEAGFPESY